MDKINEFFISGTIVNITSGTRGTQLRIATCGGNSSKTFFPNVRINAKHLPDYAQIGSHVDLWGTIAQIPAGAPDNRRWIQVMNVKKIAKSKRMLTQYIDGLDDEYRGGNAMDENRFCICGDVSHIYSPRDGVVIVTVATDDGRCNVVCYRQYAAKVKNLKIGDVIAASGNIQNISPETDENGRRRRRENNLYLQNSVAWDVEIFPQAEE